jgi:type II secretory pathway pseudopilin PulG
MQYPAIHNRSIARSFSLVEMVIAMFLLTILMAGVFSSMGMSARAAETSIFQSAAFSAAQGYLEQIKALPYGEILSALRTPAVSSLQLVSPVYNAGTNTTTINPDPFNLLPAAQPVARNIMIDRRADGTGPVIMMPIRFWVTINDMSIAATNPVQALEIIVRYEYENPVATGSTRITRQVQVVKARP